MKAPGTAYDDPRLGKDPQPATMADYSTPTEDNGGVHINSGIPNHAFYLSPPPSAATPGSRRADLVRHAHRRLARHGRRLRRLRRGHGRRGAGALR